MSRGVLEVSCQEVSCLSSSLEVSCLEVFRYLDMPRCVTSRGVLKTCVMSRGVQMSRYAQRCHV